MTKQELTSGIMLLAATFDEIMSEARLEGYWLIFKYYNADDFMAACVKVLEERERFPVPAVIRRYLPEKASHENHTR
jgi:hypothetical protein